MSSQTAARNQPQSKAKQREKRERESENAVGDRDKQGQGKGMTLAERRRLNQGKNPPKEQGRSSDTNSNTNQANGARRNPSESEGHREDNISRKDQERMTPTAPAVNQDESEEKLTLAQLRAKREKEFAERLENTVTLNNTDNQAEEKAPMTLAELRAKRDGRAGDNQKKDRGQPLTVAKQRAKREKAIAQAIEESLAPIKTEDKVQEQLKKFNINVDESARLFRKAIHDTYLNQEITDITVQVDHTVFSVHGLVLKAASEFFDKKIRVENRAFIKITDPKLPGIVFKHVLEFFYSGRLHPDVIMDMMTQGLSFLSITPSFQKMYGLALASELPLIEYFSVWLGLCQADLPIAAEIIQKHVSKEFPRLMPDKYFFQLGAEHVVDLLSCDELNTENEERVCDMALHWLGQNSWKEDDANSIFRCLRLHRVSTSYLENYVEDYPLLKHFPVCEKIVEEVRYYHEQPGRRHDFYDKRLHFRSVSPLTEAMVVFGGVKVDGSRSNKMLAFNFNTQAWCSLGTVPFDLGQEFAYCTYENDIYVSGGTSELRQMTRFVATKVRWAKSKPMQIGRSGHCMEVVDNCIYVLGGVDESMAVIGVIEEYAVPTGIWRAGNHLMFAVNNACSAVIKDKIYVLGGKMDHKSVQTSSMVQCFDPRKGSVSIINSMPMKLLQPRSIKINKNVYIINQDGRIYEIDEDHLTVTQIGSIPDFNRKKFGVYVHHGKILIMGGHLKDKVFGEVVCFKPNIHQALVCPWEDMMPPVRSEFGMVKIVMEKSLLKEELLSIDNTKT